MKKILILVAIMTCVGWSVGALYIDYSYAEDRGYTMAGETTWIKIINDEPMNEGFAGFLILERFDNFEWTGNFIAHPNYNPQVYSNQSVDYYFEFMGVYQIWEIDLTIPGGGIYSPAVWFEAQILCTGLGENTIWLADKDMNLVYAASIWEAPEPMSITLLCFGGLILRKKSNPCALCAR